MSYQVQLQPSGKTFTNQNDQTLLDAAFSADLTVPHGCRSGVCGACKGKIVQGRFEHGSPAAHALSTEDRAAGKALLCCAKPLSDLTIEIEVIEREAIPVKELSVRVSALERLTDDVIRLDLQLPADVPFIFRAGQYIDFILEDGERRSFSIANAPHQEGSLELHIRKIPNGRFTGHVFDNLKVRDILRIEGPLGSFCLREKSNKPIILLCSGTGFAPIKGIVEHAIYLGLKRPISLYRRARTANGLYQNEMPQSWQSTLPDFRYIPVISDDHVDDEWTGRTGLVTDAVLADFPDLSGHELYASGTPNLLEAARAAFLQHGLPENAFFSDAFAFARK